VRGLYDYERHLGRGGPSDENVVEMLKIRVRLKVVYNSVGK
jgi:hypothetical protein